MFRTLLLSMQIRTLREVQGLASRSPDRSVTISMGGNAVYNVASFFMPVIIAAELMYRLLVLLRSIKLRIKENY